MKTVASIQLPPKHFSASNAQHGLQDHRVCPIPVTELVKLVLVVNRRLQVLQCCWPWLLHVGHKHTDNLTGELIPIRDTIKVYEEVGCPWLGAYWRADISEGSASPSL